MEGNITWETLNIDRARTGKITDKKLHVSNPYTRFTDLKCKNPSCCSDSQIAEELFNNNDYNVDS